MIGYLGRLLTGKSSNLTYNCVNRQGSSIQFKCLTKIEQILDECGLSEVWLNQRQIFNEGNNNAVKWIKYLVEKRLQGQFLQGWRADVDVHSSCSLDKEYKNKFEFEKYILKGPEFHLPNFVQIIVNYQL